MKDVLFRGKRRSDGKWIFGYLARHPQDTRLAYIFLNPVLVNTGKNTVDPDTVGMDTGFNTEEGVPIFEGDIIKAENLPNEGGEVCWDDEIGQWIVAVDYPDDEYEEIALCQIGAHRVILGNRFDNPELL